MNSKSESPKRYAARLLFQFVVETEQGDLHARRTCEMRTIAFAATDARQALRHAKRSGRSAEVDYQNSDKQKVRFEFIGVNEMIELGVECTDEEVWYEILDIDIDDESLSQLIPTEPTIIASVENRPSSPLEKDPVSRGN